MSSTKVLDDVFEYLEMAGKLEAKDRIEAATKYYEAVYLMRRYMEKLPVDDVSNRKIKQLLTEKANHYERVAFNLMNDESSTMSAAGHDDGISALTYSPRSPLLTTTNNNSGQQHFFPDDSSVAPVLTQRSVLSCNSPRATDNIASEANAKLAVALDLDEDGKSGSAIKVYMEAAEIYLQAIQMTKSQKSMASQSIEAVLKIRMGQILDRVEELKHPQQKKKHVDQSLQMKQPAHSSLTAEEIEVLKQSSLIASGLFLPWSDDDAAKLAVEATQSQSILFTDPDGFLPLSDKQKKRFHRWSRPTEILRIRQQHAVLGSVLKPAKGGPTMVKAITPYTIQQQYVTDCSFIASLCICATFERRFRKRLVTSILYPQNKSGELMLNPNGKYMVKLWLNGVARCVVIDDYLPIDKYGNLLCSQTTHNNDSTIELWVCLIEKAYMKLCGGYDFPGSNSGVDLFSLTGWIPERIHFAKDPAIVRDYETPAERAWERILSANSYGDCLITVSTQSDLSEEQAEQIGLVTGHAYAVLAVVQTKNGTRLLQLKNPWAHKSWKGRFSSGDKESWRGSLSKEVGYDPDIAAKHDDGVFWICWEDILVYFQNFHLSWNPALFQSRLSMHGCWPRDQGPPDDTFNIGENPQYCLELSDKAIKKNATLWILVSRHVTKQEQEGAEVKDYLTVHIHRNNAKRERIWYPGRSGNCVLTGCYTNNPHVLIRYDVQDSKDKHLSLVLSQYKKSNSLNYTISCFCTESFHLGKPEQDLQHRVEICSTWTTYTAGGPVGQKNFIKNPQFAIRLASTTTLQILLSTTTTVAANVMLVPVKQLGATIDSATGDPVLDSGQYRHGFVASEKKTVNSGTYTLIVSNFHVDQTGLFTLKIVSSKPVTMEKI